jgi:two-component system OmpR family sensor kinase
MSLRARLLIATSVAVVLGLLVVGAVTYSLFVRSQIQQVDSALERAHMPTEQLAATGDPTSWSVIPEVAPGLYVAILDRNGEQLFASPAITPGEGPVTIDPEVIDLRRQQQTVMASDGEGMRLRVDPISGGRTVVVGDSLHELNETRGRLLAVLALSSGLAIGLVVFAAWWLVGAGLKPLRSVEASAAAITDDDLGDQRVPGADEHTEVGSLARALNAMLDRLDTAREEREHTLEELVASESRMRQFVADASHELRTPIAATAAYAELFEAGARERPADLDRAMSGIRTETARMGELVDDLLLLARLDEHRPLAMESVDLTELVLAAVDAARVLEPEREFKVAIDGVIRVNGDPARLRQVVDNLLANVRSHTTTSAQCAVSLSAQPTEAVLTISDTGPGVDPDQLDRLRDRFFRVDSARTRSTGGSGLGLAIAGAIVEAHGGNLTPSLNQPRGLMVTVRIPTTQDSQRSPEVADVAET